MPAVSRTHPFLCTPKHILFSKLQHNTWAPAPKSEQQASLSGFLSSHPVERFVDAAKETGVALALQKFHNQSPSWQQRNLSCKCRGACCSASATSAGPVRRPGLGRQRAPGSSRGFHRLLQQLVPYERLKMQAD